jgi:type IV pilus assembly protein PilM
VAVELIDVDVLALVNGYLESVEGQNLQGTTRALINVGAQLTNVVILRGAVPYLVRDVPWGGDKLTRTVADQLGIDADAVNKAMAQTSPPAEVSSAIKVSSESLATELQLSFDYFENRFNQPPEEIYVAGGLSQSPGFLNALKAQLAQALTPWSPLQGLPGQLAVAYGLALRTN